MSKSWRDRNLCGLNAYLRYLDEGPAVVDAVGSELSGRLDLTRRYAVRSSANIDDLDHSFAGQFKSVLDVQGLDDVLQAICSIWATT